MVRIWIARVHPTGVDAGYSAAPGNTAGFQYEFCDTIHYRKNSAKD